MLFKTQKTYSGGFGGSFLYKTCLGVKAEAFAGEESEFLVRSGVNLAVAFEAGFCEDLVGASVVTLLTFPIGAGFEVSLVTDGEEIFAGVILDGEAGAAFGLATALGLGEGLLISAFAFSAIVAYTFFFFSGKLENSLAISLLSSCCVIFGFFFLYLARF